MKAFRIAPDGDASDPEGTWAGTAGVGDHGALLVRPDGFVAWRAKPAAQATFSWSGFISGPCLLGNQSQELPQRL